MLFIALMFITTTCVAGAAAFFSVYGLAHTFAASFWSVVFMGGALEAGKLMLASYLYRFKDTVTLKAKALGYVFVFVLMMITSLGIYGYLADAYQSGTTSMKQVNATLNLKKEEQATLQKRKEDIDAQIAAVPATDTRGKQRVMRQFGPEITKVNDRLSVLSTEIRQEVEKQISADSHVGPIVFVAKILGIAPDNAISLLILAIVFVFDPVAIYLTIATNTALAKYNDQKEKPDTHHKEPPMSEPVDTLSQGVETFSKKDADEWYEYVPPEDHHNLPDIEIDLPSHPLVQDEAQKAEPSDPSEWELEPIVMADPMSENTSELESPAISLVVTDGPYYPPPREPADPAKMKALGELFSKEQTEDVAAEEGTEAPPEQQLAKIYEEVAAKDVSEQTPMDIETMNRIERFFKRQDLIKNVRTGQN